MSPDALRRALSLRDLTDPAQGPHAVQLLLDAALAALGRAWPGCRVLLHRASPVVTVEDNYDALGYPPDGAARDARYTRWLDARTLLRTQTSASIPPLLRRLARGDDGEDVLLACPGLVYRRDAIDRTHVGEPHQLDLWRLRRGLALGADDLRRMVALVAGALVPDRPTRLAPATHPYTRDGLQVDVAVDDERGEARWLELLECGLAAPELLARHGLAGWSGLALGVGLDRALMLRKGLDDIRLLRSEDPRVARQLLDLAPWRPVSRWPAQSRDLSLAVAADEDAETLGDRVREALGDEAAWVEEVAVVSRTAGPDLPPAARARLGLRDGQVNVLLRVVLRHPGRALAQAEANALRDRVWTALHEGAPA